MFQEYLRPATVQEAIKLRKSTPQSIYFAGGTEINSRVWPCRPEEMPEVAISVERLPLREIRIDGGKVSIGAAVTIQALIDTPGVPPMLAAALKLFANRNVRSAGTIGGNVGGNRSCSNIAPTLMALDASIRIADESGESSMNLSDHLAATDPTALILSFEIPAGWEKRGWAVRKHCRTYNDVSIVSVGVSLAGSAAKIEKPIIAVNGCSSRATRLVALENRLEGKPLPPREEIDALVKPLVDPVGDLRGSAAFKRHLAAVLVSDSIHEAIKKGAGR
jgi:putative selenate reductase FAD-binding subunit